MRESPELNPPPRAGVPEHPGPRLRWPPPRQFEQPDDTATLPAIGLEQLEHPCVIGAPLSCQRPADHARNVVVADGDRVWIAAGDREHLRLRPRANATDEADVDAGLEPGRSSCARNERLRPAPLETETVKREVGRRGNALSRWRRARAGGPRRRLPEGAQHPVVGATRLRASHLLLGDRPQQRLEHGVGSPQAKAPEAALEVANEWMPGCEVLWTVVLAEQRRSVRHRPLRARPPGLDGHFTRDLLHDPGRGGAERRPRRPPRFP